MNLALLHLCDSAFPLGAFAYSDGLEWATSVGLVAKVDDLSAWMDAVLEETFARLEGPAVWEAWAAARRADKVALIALDQELTALRPSRAARKSSRAMGARLLATWPAVRPDAAAAIDMMRDTPVALPVAFGIVCASSEIDRRDAVEAFAYTRLAATTSAAMRLMPIGQTAAHAVLARALDRIPAVVDAVASRGGRLESFAPALDVAAMSQPHLHSRLFRS